MRVRRHDVLLQAVLPVEAFVAERALEAVGRRVEALVAATRARLCESFAAVPTRVRQLVSRHTQQIVTVTRRLQPPLGYCPSSRQTTLSTPPR